jgi:hypothetical protein
LSDYTRDKRVIGAALGLTGENVMIHWFQLRAINILRNVSALAPATLVPESATDVMAG